MGANAWKCVLPSHSSPYPLVEQVIDCAAGMTHYASKAQCDSTVKQAMWSLQVDNTEINTSLLRAAKSKSRTLGTRMLCFGILPHFSTQKASVWMQLPLKEQVDRLRSVQLRVQRSNLPLNHIFSRASHASEGSCQMRNVHAKLSFKNY